MDIKSTADKLLKVMFRALLMMLNQQSKSIIDISWSCYCQLPQVLAQDYLFSLFLCLSNGSRNLVSIFTGWHRVFTWCIVKIRTGFLMPVNGGAYVYLERSFGPIIGTISGLGLWASFLLKSAFALIGFSAYMYAVTNTLI